MLIAQQRREQLARSIFVDLHYEPDGTSVLDAIPARPEQICDMGFLERTAELSNQEAMVLWMRIYRGMSVDSVAEMLKVSRGSVKLWTRTALASLKKI